MLTCSSWDNSGHVWEAAVLSLITEKEARLCLLFVCLFGDRVSLCRPGWLLTHRDPPASPSPSSGTKGVTTLDLCDILKGDPGQACPVEKVGHFIHLVRNGWL